MTADDDRLDPAVNERFRALDSVAVPDTWSQVDDRLAIGDPDRRTSAWWAVAAAALVVALVGGIVLTRGGGDGEVVVGPSGTAASPAPGGTNAPPGPCPNRPTRSFLTC